MLDGSAAGPLLDDLSEEELLAGGAAWPCTWILLQPSTKGPRHQSPTQPIAVPLRIDNVRAGVCFSAALTLSMLWSPCANILCISDAVPKLPRCGVPFLLHSKWMEAASEHDSGCIAGAAGLHGEGGPV